MRTLFLALSALLLAPLAAAQKTYFVDAVNGNDSNSGLSRSQPLLSITKAVGIMGDGDQMVVLPGTYGPTATGEVYPIQFGVSSQIGIRVYGEGGPAVTVIDGEQRAISDAVPLFRFRWPADGVSFSGFTIKNTGSVHFWSMAIRCGSTSGGGFAARNVEIHGNVFMDVHRAVVAFGTDPINSNQTTGIHFHDNLIVNTTFPAVALYGNGANSAYNNTIVNSSSDGIYVDDVFNLQSASLVANNIIHNGTGNGIRAGPFGLGATYLGNNCFGNATNYTGTTFDPSNLSVDPMFVNEMGRDFRLKPGSPMLQNGTTALPFVRHDLDRFPRAHDSDANGNAGVDRGAYQLTQLSMKIAGPWGIGRTVNYNFTSPAVGFAFVFFARKDAAVLVQPFGSVLVDPLGLLSFLTLSGRAPGALPLNIPNDPALSGVTLAQQGGILNLGNNAFHLVNGEIRTF